MAARRYEDLDAWKLAHDLKLEMYRITDSGPVLRDRSFRDQLREAAASAPANIAEGFGRFLPRDFARFLGIARASLDETHNHLRDGFDRGHWSLEEAQRVQKMASRAAGAATRLIRYLNRPSTIKRFQS